ncbi:hypothetical protein JZ751_007420 [Albula glossodonta]|uniref:Uncharacterized protein n=1 Tax=Albula glossodonta TaxID=121402 RepID=A0A8T2N298_9TELE|nr:hypothetical protein JZ751_007420 [Albula glossodonta]
MDAKLMPVDRPSPLCCPVTVGATAPRRAVSQEGGDTRNEKDYNCCHMTERGPEIDCRRCLFVVVCLIFFSEKAVW